MTVETNASRVQGAPIPRAIANDIASPSAHADARLPRALAWLRANNPLGYAEPDGYEPFWVVTKHADLRAIAMRTELFRNGDQSISLIDIEQQKRLLEALDGRHLPYRHMLLMDPPEHPKYRAIAAELFHARTLDAIADDIRAIAREFIDRLAATGGECDFAREIAYTYPLRVIMGIMGVPPEDEMLMLRFTQDLMGTSETEEIESGEALAGLAAGERVLKAAGGFDGYFEAMMDERRRVPRDDLVSIIANARIDGAPMPRLESLSYCLVVATAGHDTTASVTAGAVQAMCENPAEHAKVKADPSLIKGLVEEATRWVSPSKVTMRTVNQDVDLLDRSFRDGDRIGMAWQSGNRDEAVFGDPELFRVDRKPNKLVSYGIGPHVCLGQHLARLEMRIFFEEFFRRVDHIELTGPVKYAASLLVSGPMSVPIRFRMK